MKLSDIFYDDAWICDPKKCPNCPKTVCHDGFCYHTLDKNQRARGIKRFIFFLEFLIFGAPLMRHCLNEMACKMAEQLLPYCEFNSSYDFDTDRIVLRSRVRVIRSGPAIMDMDDPFGYRF